MTATASSLPAPATSATLPPPARKKAPVSPRLSAAPVPSRLAATPAATMNEKPAAGLQLICKQADLARGLSIVGRAVMPLSTRPILRTILLSSDRGRLRLQATDLEMGIQAWIDAQIVFEGMIAVPADLLTKAIQSMKSQETLELRVDAKQTLFVKARGSETSLRSKDDPREFPLLASIEEGEEHPAYSVIEATQLKKMIDDTAFAAGEDKGRPVLMGVFFQLGVETLTMAAANTFRLVEFVAPLVQGQEASPILIPATIFQELARILPAQGQVKILITAAQNQVIFQCEQGDRITFVSRLIEGQYLAYRRSIPQEFSTRAELDTKALSAACESAAIFAHGDFQTVRVTIRPKEEAGSETGSLTVEAEDPDLGSHIGSIPATVSGPTCQLLFPVRYLREAVAHLSGQPQVMFGVISPGKPGVFKPLSTMRYTSMVLSATKKNAGQAQEQAPTAEKKQ